MPNSRSRVRGAAIYHRVAPLGCALLLFMAAASHPASARDQPKPTAFAKSVTLRLRYSDGLGSFGSALSRVNAVTRHWVTFIGHDEERLEADDLTPLWNDLQHAYVRDRGEGVAELYIRPRQGEGVRPDRLKYVDDYALAFRMSYKLIENEMRYVHSGKPLLVRLCAAQGSLIRSPDFGLPKVKPNQLCQPSQLKLIITKR